MPIVHLEILQGRTTGEVQQAMSAVTDALVTTLSVAPEQVRVLVAEIPRTHWSVGGAAVEAALVKAGEAE